jgi:glucokinase
MSDKMILAGDIGGTKSYLGLFKMEGSKVRPITEIKKYPSPSYSSLTALVQEFLSYLDKSSLREDEKFIGVACFGIAGPVETDKDGKYCKMTHPESWPIVKESDFSQLLNDKPVILLNDLEAMGYGISQLADKDLVELNHGIPQEGNRAVIAAGTGLGQVILHWDGKDHYPSPSEGGHANWASPYDKDNLYIDLLSHLQKKFQGNVGVERVLSGEGLVNIYEFLKERGKDGNEPIDWEKRLSKNDPAELISQFAKEGNTLCSKALDVFMDIYGATAGDLALQYLAVGGIYIGGGIALKNLAELCDGTFMQAFTAKEKKYPHFTQLNANIPVKVIKNPQVGLLGAAWRAAKT